MRPAAGDQAETFLQRAIWCSGLHGLAAMAPVTRLSHLMADHSDQYRSITVARPLLAAHKADVYAYCRANNIPWAEDPTNKDARYTRAAFRALLERSEHAPAAAAHQRNCSTSANASATYAQQPCSSREQEAGTTECERAPMQDVRDDGAGLRALAAGTRPAGPVLSEGRGSVSAAGGAGTEQASEPEGRGSFTAAGGAGTEPAGELSVLADILRVQAACARMRVHAEQEAARLAIDAAQPPGPVLYWIRKSAFTLPADAAAGAASSRPHRLANASLEGNGELLTDCANPLLLDCGTNAFSSADPFSSTDCLAGAAVTLSVERVCDADPAAVMALLQACLQAVHPQQAPPSTRVRATVQAAVECGDVCSTQCCVSVSNKSAAA